MSKGEIAREHFAKGYNCAQSVLLTYADELAMDKTFAARLTNFLGGGISGTGGICGALSAGCLVFSCKYGRETESREGEQLRRQQRTYRLVQDFQRRFEGEFGATGCPGLLEKGFFDSGAAKNNKFNCPLYVGRAADLVEEMLAEEEQTAAAK